jgi:hypothetical protein
LTENSTGPITSTISTELPETSTPGTETVDTSPPAITTTSATPLPTTSDQTTTVIAEETTTEEQWTGTTSAGSTEFTDITDAITTTTEPATTIPEGGTACENVFQLFELHPFAILLLYPYYNHFTLELMIFLLNFICRRLSIVFERKY